MSEQPQDEERKEELPVESTDDLAPEPEAPKEPVVSKWDVVVLIVLLMVGGGFWYWYSTAQKDSTSHFHVADSLYDAGKLPEALKAYRDLRTGESIISKKDDSLMYLRMDTLEAMEEQDIQLASGARAALTSEDTALIRAAADAVKERSHGFVPRALLDSLRI